MRSTDELKRARRDLFDAFPYRPTPDGSLRFQQQLIEEILRTEREQVADRSDDRTAHLRAVRLYGDALAFSLLSTYAIRQLSRNTGKAPYLSAQGKAFDLVAECATVVAESGVSPLLADLTNIVKNGDLLACADRDLPAIVECKLSKPSVPHFERQGRRGRQLARIESITEFLRVGRGTIFGEGKERTTVEIDHFPRYGYAIVDELVDSALQHKPVAMIPSADELYAVSLVGETADVSAAIAGLRVQESDHVAVGSSLDTLLSGTWEVPPPILWMLSPPGRWALMEGEVTISHAVRVEALVGLEQEGARVSGVVELSGSVPWGYSVDVREDEPLTISANVVLDVIYRHETLASAGARLLAMAERAASTLRGPAV